MQQEDKTSPAGNSSGIATVDFEASHTEHGSNGGIYPNKKTKEAGEHGATQAPDGERKTEESRGPPERKGRGLRRCRFTKGHRQYGMSRIDYFTVVYCF